MDGWNLVFGLAGAVTGLGGLLYAQFAYRVAEKSNRIADRALAEAAEANRIAVEANQLAEDANAVSSAAVRIPSEDFKYVWLFWIEDDGVCTVTHSGAHEAYDLTFTSEVKRSNKAVSPDTRFSTEEDTVSHGDQITFDLHSIFPECITEARSQPLIRTAVFDEFTATKGRQPVEFDVVVVLAWKTLGGRACGDALHHRVSCRENKAGDIIFTLLR